MSRHHRMPAADVAWLHMDRPTNLMVNNVVLWFDAPVDWDRVKEICRERLVGRFPRFRQRVAKSRLPWRPVAWEDDPLFDLEHHFHHLALPAPGDHTTLLELVADLMATPLDHDKPLWDMYLVEGYGPGCAIVFRTHHCIADGTALVRVTQSLTEDAPDVAAAPQTRRAGPHLGRMMRSATRGARAPSKPVLAGSGTHTVLKGKLGVAQRVASSRPIRLADVKRTGHATGTTVNDVIVSAVTGALRSYLLERGSPLAEIGATVPVNLRPLSEPLPRDLGNEFGPVPVSLPVLLDDPQERLAEVHRRMAEIKHSPEGARAYRLLRVIGMLPTALGLVVTDRRTAKATTLITNVPGPEHRVALAGTPVHGMLVWAPRPGGMSMSVTIFSYNDEIIVGLAADAGLIPDPDRILAGVEDELAEIERLAGRSTHQRSAA